MRKRNFRKIPDTPSLFDSLEGFGGPARANFEIIPPERIAEIARKHGPSRRPAIDEMPELDPSDKIFFMSFGSGSSGNCSYVGDRRSGFLIDAGVDADHVMLKLQRNGIMPGSVKGIILTHDHHDHISQVYALLRQNKHMKLYCTPRTLKGMLRRRSISRRINDYHTPVHKEFPFAIDAFTITPFEVMHDGADNVGFFIEHGSKTLAVATDLGCISERVDFYFRQAQNLVMESNYDRDALVSGSYPEHLKHRILTDNGHLDNKVGAAYVASIYTPSLRNLFLCHLSHDNNTPELALEAFADELSKVGVEKFDTVSIPPYSPDHPLERRLAVIPLPRYDTTPLYTL